MSANNILSKSCIGTGKKCKKLSKDNTSSYSRSNFGFDDGEIPKDKSAESIELKKTVLAMNLSRAMYMVILCYLKNKRVKEVFFS